MAIDLFRGKYGFLSNFWSVDITVKGKVYPSVEHAFCAAKTLNEDEREKIRLAETPSKAKQLGKKVTLREDWEDVEIKIMELLVRKKFSQKHMEKLLLSTGDEELIEGNWWKDTFWGVCDGVGENHLGKILMKIREEKRK